LDATDTPEEKNKKFQRRGNLVVINSHQDRKTTENAIKNQDKWFPGVIKSMIFYNPRVFTGDTFVKRKR